MEPPRTPEEGNHLTEDLVDKSMQFIADSKQIDPDKPFYLHLCFGATHAPHHAPKEWIRQVRRTVRRRLGRLPGAVTFARQKELGIIPADAELSWYDPHVPMGVAPRRPPASRRMTEVFAGFLSHATTTSAADRDSCAAGELDNTIVMVISDNGASAEGGPRLDDCNTHMKRSAGE